MHQTAGCPLVVDGVSCGRDTIRSHSIQRRGPISILAENGHLSTLMKHPGSKHTISGFNFTEISGKRASTFPGLCAKHDHVAFKVLEQGPLRPSYQVALRLAEREALYEAVVHGNAALFLAWLTKVPDFEIDIDTSLFEPELENMAFYTGYNWALLGRLNRVSKRSSPRKLFFLSILLDVQLPFTSSGCFCIEVDTNGRKLQKFSMAQRFAYGQLSVLPQEDNTTLLTVSSLGDQNAAVSKGFVRSFSKGQGGEVADSFLNASLNYTEKIFFKSSFLRSLGDEQLSEIQHRADDSDYHLVGVSKPDDAISRDSAISFGGEILKIATNC